MHAFDLDPGKTLRDRVVARTDHPRRHEARTCELAGCEQTTRGGKPYCTLHVERTGYAQHLLKTLERSAREVARVGVEGPRAVDPAGLVAQEILRELRVRGARTALYLCRTLAVEPTTLRHYLTALAREGLLRLRRTRRGVVAAPASARSRWVA